MACVIDSIFINLNGISYNTESATLHACVSYFR